ncbi:M23 family metallopeptidase [Acuticoccus sp. M5D2P5]|uniref:M23 family metallopeptidase n=1 Tax=Acuticoccus kalidii TaxID=2910977 RepID=UPI001F280B8F|nr:M23 family metallopeptidase [Acuticoccus kalidii]MCF3932909.1 M23 family metallopeptidase [Acuticoccus kalidii]
MRTALFLFAGLVLPSIAAADPGPLSMPVDCEPGENCFIQKYVDVDPGEGIADFECGHLSSPAHKGTDIRPLIGETLQVIAPADGRMLRGRDGVPDRDFAKPLDVDPSMACGNGLVLDLGDGLTAQICHLKPGTIAVRPGDAVKRGDVLGTIGASGLADFTHVHIQFMRGDEVIDPFTGLVMGAGECGEMGEPLWNAAAQEALAEAGRTHVIALGFNDAPVGVDMIENGTTNADVKAGAKTFVAYGLAIGVEEGDRQRIVLEGPGFDIDNEAEIDRPMAQSMRFAGRRVEDGLRAGEYHAKMEIIRDGAVVATREASITIE